MQVISKNAVGGKICLLGSAFPMQRTSKKSLTELLSLNTARDQLMSIISNYPNEKRGRKLRGTKPEVVSGVYIIVNSVNNKVYVGSSLDIKKRWKDHKWFLSHNKHHNPHLQLAWNKYGAIVFEFSILEVESNPSLLLEAEQRWMQWFGCCDRLRGYNSYSCAGSSYGYKASEETRKKCSERNKRAWADLESREKRIKAIKEAHNTPLAIAKRSEISKHNWQKPEYREKIIKAHSNPEWKKQQAEKTRNNWTDSGYRQKNIASRNTPENKEKLRETVKKLWENPKHKELVSKANSKHWYEFTSPDGEVFIDHSATRFAKEHGLQGSLLRKVARGERKHHKGWKARVIASYKQNPD